MDHLLDNYLENIDRHLKPMAASERIDIVAEIKSEMSELIASGNTSDEIITRLGDPKELAKAYLGEAIVQNSAFSWRRVCSIVAFYSLAGAMWTFLLPLTSTLGIAFMACGIISPIAGVIKFIGFMFGFDIPNIHFSIGSFSADAITFLPISIIVGILSFVLGKLLWALTIKLIKGLSKTKAKVRH